MPTVSVIVPVYNEEKTLAEVLTRLQSLDLDLQILVVDDASTDNTAAIAQNTPGITVLRQLINSGKGAAIRKALPETTGEIVAIQDADLEYFPEDLPALVLPFDDPTVDAVYGTRFVPQKPNMRFANFVANRILAVAANILFAGRITDEATCYKLIRREILLNMDLSCQRFEFCPEVTAKLLKNRMKIVEVPIRYNPRTYGEGKKITWKDGFEAIWTLLRFRFRN